MAAPLIKLDKNKDQSRKAIRGMELCREALRAISDARLLMIQSRDGDGSSSTHYDLTAAEGGYQAGDYADANAAAKRSYEEVDALWGAMNALTATIEQCCSFHGV